ncbi:MAG: hypothetical protein H0V14_07055 [Chitinophagaceae bacterium]|nr:hypothetical protein [Chitinophagaceae bacterium]
MKSTAFTLLFIWLTFMNIQNDNTKSFHQNSSVEIISVSQQLLLAAKTKESTDSLVNILKNTSAEDKDDEKSDNIKKAFRINL